MPTKLDATTLLGEATGLDPRSSARLPVAALIDEDTTESDLDVALRLHAEKRERLVHVMEQQLNKAMRSPNRTFGKE
jgi:hypothetical protein